MLSTLIDDYKSRLKSYQYLLDKVEREMDGARDPAFAQFCDCESKRLRDLIQLTKKVVSDLQGLHPAGMSAKRLDAPKKKPEDPSGFR